jgi:hypothetical protein
MDEENTIPGEDNGTSRRSIARVGFELLIVFIGVWAALLAENWRERREEDRAAVAVLEAALTQLRESTEWASRWSDSVQAEYAAWKERRSEGEVIPPFFMRIPGSESPPVGIFGAASNLPDALGPVVVSRMGSRANEMEGVGRRNSRYMESTERLVFPLLAADPSVFYESISGDLLPQFQGQLLLMEELLAQWAQQNRDGAELAEFLEGELRRRR